MIRNTLVLLSPPLRPEPNASPSRVKYKPCNLTLKRKDARDSPRWDCRCKFCGEGKRYWPEPSQRTSPAEGYVSSRLFSP
ncbi:hypothetical protein MAP00_002590 [Monascus purpureus]|nr:hypothetical protein MAP00_002590 [Monascus purpureus]